MDEVRMAFRSLLLEVPDPDLIDGSMDGAAGSSQALLGPGDSSLATSSPRSGGHSAGGAASTNGSGGAGGEASGSGAAEGERRGAVVIDAGSPLHSAIVRARLVGHLVGCYEATVAELAPEEAPLWDAFVAGDANLRAMLQVPSEAADSVIEEMPLPAERFPDCAAALVERASEEGEVDFADVLDVLACERELCRQWSLGASIRSSVVDGLSSLLAGVPGSSRQGPRRTSRVAELRIRCARLASPRLAAAAAAYQRSLVLTSSWRCERSLLQLILPTHAAGGVARGGGPGAANVASGRCRGLVAPLLAVLRGINAELTTTERVLWELLGSSDANFDGLLTKSEVFSAITELMSHAAAREAAAEEPSAELEELIELRKDCQRQSVQALFTHEGGNGHNRKAVTLADVLRWWWDMPEEYRIAAGLTVPAWLIKRSIQRQPEEMFKAQLRRTAADVASAQIALHGYVRVFAELRSLAVRRSVEGLHSRTPTETQVSTTTTSEVGDNVSGECMVTNDAEEEDEELEDDDDDDDDDDGVYEAHRLRRRRR